MYESHKVIIGIRVLNCGMPFIVKNCLDHGPNNYRDSKP